MSLTVTITDTNVATVAAVSGRLTLGEGATQLRETLQKLIADGKRNVVLNLSDLSYLDSAGIGLLVSSFASMNRVGGSMKLSSLSSRVKDVLLITKLLTVFETHDNEADAIRSFQSSANV